MIRAFAVAMSLVAGSAAALTLDVPARAVETAHEERPGADVAWPVTSLDRFDETTDRRRGTLNLRSWRIPESALTPMQIIAPLKASLVDQGFSVDFECVDAVCGGFDFRFALDTIGAPEMHVDLGDFRYLTAHKGAGPGRVDVAILASRSAVSGYLHIARIGADGSATVAVQAPVSEESDGLEATLLRDGRAVLDGLGFASGASDLSTGPYGALAELAGFLESNPGARIVLVGHTDADGTLERNVALSRARAASVRARLIDVYGIAAARIDAEGVGYLMPLEANSTSEGRERNRRVEAVLLALP